MYSSKFFFFFKKKIRISFLSRKVLNTGVPALHHNLVLDALF